MVFAIRSVCLVMVDDEMMSDVCVRWAHFVIIIYKTLFYSKTKQHLLIHSFNVLTFFHVSLVAHLLVDCRRFYICNSCFVSNTPDLNFPPNSEKKPLYFDLKFFFLHFFLMFLLFCFHTFLFVGFFIVCHFYYATSKKKERREESAELNTRYYIDNNNIFSCFF